jgi:formylglycine-generating enzyme required for sulfatase activity/tetratricopeptide (TPR) repeat protein
MSSPSGADALPATLSAPTLSGSQPAPATARDDAASIVALPESFHEYDQVRFLGAGAMGQVYRARDTLLDRLVAIKVMSTPSPAHDERMHVEAKAAAAIKHPNVVTVHRVGALDGRPYIVTEYIDGTSLDVMPRPVPWQRALDIGIDLARGLAAAHRHGVLHRDIKPGNAIVDKSGQAKLIDFGLAVRAGSDATGAIKLAGTPSYMAPELWKHEPPSQHTDIYAMGVLLYELCTGDLPRPASSTREIPRLEDKIPGIDARFAALVHRCLAAVPAERFASGDALCQALEGLQVTRPVLPTGNPYRGLLPFETAHRELFFGRSAEIQLVIERVRAQHFVLLGGESGVGKSSLARAGVLPLVAEGALADELTWTIHRQVPGRRPLLMLVHALAVMLEMDEDTILSDIEQGDVLGVSRRLRRRHGKGRGLLLFFDQLEELVTLADRREAERTSAFLASLEGTPGIRVLATARLDYLAALAALPGLGPLVERSLYIIRPLKAEAVRQVVVEPARAKGVRFENEALIERLVTAATGTGGALPLLQFALAQLWEQRDVHEGVITVAAFDAIGGVEGALSRHATGVHDALLPETRQAMRHLLVRLVTSNGTRARQTATELGVHEHEARRKAIAALVEGRLVVADELDGEPVYEIAHEALISGWPKLRAWLDRASNIRAVQERLTAATREWERSGRAQEYLWGPKQLAAGEAIERADLSDAEAAFLAASARAIRNGRWLRRLAVVAVLALLAAAYGVYRFNDRFNVEQELEKQLAKAERAVDEARALRGELQAEHDAMTQLARDDRAEAAAHWQRFLDLAPEVDARYQHATLPLELALNLDPNRERTRALMSALLDDRARLAEIMGRTREREQLVERLSVYDRAAYERWHEAVQVSVDADPDATVTIERYDASPDSTHVGPESMLPTPFKRGLQPGSYVLHLQADEDHAEVRYPLLVHPDMAPLKTIPRPVLTTVPEGFVYIPPGRFLSGFGRDADDEPLRKFYNAAPLHERETGAFLIARHESTYEDWMKFLDACLPEGCDGLVPSLPDAEQNDTGIGVLLRAHPEHGWELVMRATSSLVHSAVRGQPLVYAGRAARDRQRWERFPVSGVSWENVQVYLQWLRVTGQLPGARLCTAEEWERAARGADARLFPHGNLLQPDDANFDLTYGQLGHNFGPDEVGAHPRSASPFGLHDMAGNVWEFVDDPAARQDAGAAGQSSDTGPATVQVRGGSYFHQAEVNTVMNEWPIMSDQKLSTVGFRICADAPL